MLKIEAKTTQAYEAYKALIATATDTQWREGINWYPTARLELKHLATKHVGESYEAKRLASYVCAALSPMNKWHFNLQDVNSVLYAWSMGFTEDTAKCHTFNSNRDKAFALCASYEKTGKVDINLIGGSKVTAFARNLDGFTFDVCIDTWMLRAANFVNKKGTDISDTPLNRLACINAIRLLANELALYPCDVQAIVWVIARGSAE